MDQIISIIEILGTIDDGAVEICATADTDYDAAAERLVVKLGAFARHVCASGDGGHVPHAWLPPGECVTEHLPRGDAAAFAREVFHSWVKKVRASVPPHLSLRQ